MFTCKASSSFQQKGTRIDGENNRGGAAAREIIAHLEQRASAARKKLRCDFAAAMPFETVNDLVHAAVMFRRIREGGGESLILTPPGAGYSATRSNDVLKIKKCPITGELAWGERRRERWAA